MNNLDSKRMCKTLSIADLLKQKDVVCLYKKNINLKTPTMRKQILELPREYRKNETVETFETVLFVTQVARDVSALPVKDTYKVLYVIEKCWKLQLAKPMHMSIARLILANSVMYN